MELELPSTIASRQDVARLRTEVERYQSWSRQYQNAAKRDIQYQTEQPLLSEAASLIIRRWLEAKRSTADLIKTLTNIANQSPSITLTLAGPPPPTTQTELVKWVRSHIDKQMLVEFRWNSSILGGMIAQTNNAMFDWSHRNLLMSSRDKLVERLTRV